MLSTLLLPSVVFLIGLALLVWSSDIFIDGAASTAIHLNISPLIIGVVVLGFGTSMPEVVVSIFASLDGNPGIAIGNAVGSNIANIALVLGVTALIMPIIVKSSLLKREFPVLIAITLIGYALIADGHLGQVDGLILLSLLIATLFWMIKVNQNPPPNDPLQEDTVHEIEALPEMSKNKALLLLGLGLIILMISAKMMVWGAESIAIYFGVPDLIIGLTIIAIGTSLPELAAAIAAAKKNEADLMIGNIIGSNLFNLLAVLAVPALLAPSLLDGDLIRIDYAIMLGLTIMMLLVALPRKGATQVTRLEGGLLFTSFILYLALLYFRSIQA